MHNTAHYCTCWCRKKPLIDKGLRNYCDYCTKNVKQIFQIII